MKSNGKKRIDEVAKHYIPAIKLSTIVAYLFWINVLFSFLIQFSNNFSTMVHLVICTIYVLGVIVHFSISNINNLFLIPAAERIRSAQLISNAFLTSITHERTELYYNNEYSPSFNRLGAIIMENTLFSKSIIKSMLKSNRIVTALYFFSWLFILFLHQNSLETLMLITQVVFSGQIIYKWLNLEILKCRYNKVYHKLHDHFLHKICDSSNNAIASILDAFANYESAKSSASVLLSTKTFEKLNPDLTTEWESIRNDLKMNCVD